MSRLPHVLQLRSLLVTVLATVLGLALVAPTSSAAAPASVATTTPATATAKPVATAPNGAPLTIPPLQNWTKAPGEFTFARTTRVLSSQSLRGFATQIGSELREFLGTKVTVASGRPNGGDVQFVLDASRDDLGEEGYAVSVGSDIRVTAATDQGLFLGSRTVLQWAKQGTVVPAGSSIDIPKYAERGIGICACQIQVSVDYLERVIREASYYKLNQLWLETKVKSTAFPKANFWAYYTREEAKRINDFAKKYRVELVVEINSPGHMGPWLYNYPELQLTNDAGVKQPTRLDITKPEALNFITTLMDEYFEVFDTPYWHMGADEYMLGSGYEQYPQILEAARAAYGPNAVPTDAFIDFINKVNDEVKKRGKRLRIWNDGIPTGGNAVLDKDILVEHWESIGKKPLDLLRAGNDVQNSTYALYHVRGGYQASPEQLWAQNWTPLNFRGQTITPAQAAAAPGKITGAKLSAWPDNGAGNTENQMEKLMHPTLAFVSQATWASPRPVSSWADFAALNKTLGYGPGQPGYDQDLGAADYAITTPQGALTAKADGGPVTVTSGTAPTWRFTPTDDGYYTIRDQFGRCLDMRGPGEKLWLGVPTESGLPAETAACSSARNLQKWWVRAVDGGFTLTNAIVLQPLVVGARSAGSVTQEAPDQHTPTTFEIRALAPSMTLGTLDTVLPGGSSELQVTVQNTLADAVRSGAVSFSVPDGWTVSPASLDTGALEPGETWTGTVTVTAPTTLTGSGSVPLEASLTWDTRRANGTVTRTLSVGYGCTLTPSSPQAVVRADSQETAGENGRASNAIDGNPATFWHTAWSTGNPPPPHEIVVDLGAVTSFCGINALPRQNADNGQIRGYEVYVTNDPAVAAGTDLAAWGEPLATGEFPLGRQVKRVDLAQNASARYVKLRATSSWNDDPWTTLAELSFDVP